MREKEREREGGEGEKERSREINFIYLVCKILPLEDSTLLFKFYKKEIMNTFV